MTKRLSRPPASSLRAAFEADKAFALSHHRRGTERIADLMTVPPHVLYKWLETRRMPVSCLSAWEHATGSDQVVRYLAAAAHKAVIDLPTGRRLAGGDIQTLQGVLHDAVGQLMGFVAGTQTAEATIAALTHGIESLAWHRENVRRADQPELELEIDE